tara:strand:+ start:395 stop:1324 length:930 start_codon:yes stop_codon:yes gene_type:complete
MLKILITGGAGYIGSRLINQLSITPNIHITSLDTYMFDQKIKSNTKNITYLRGDVRDEKLIQELIKKNDVFIPLAAYVGAPLCKKFPKETEEINYKAVEFMCGKLSKDQRVLMPVTNSGYGIGEKDKFCDETSPLKPISLYGKTKVMAEDIIMQRENSISFRLATVFGVSERMRIDLLVNNFTYIACFEKKLEIFEPHFRRNYIHISDISRAFIFALDNFQKLKGEIFNLGLSNANLTKEQLCMKIQDVIKDFEYIIVPEGEDPDKRDYFVSNKKIESKGFMAKFSLEDGISELYKYYLSDKFTPSKNY